MYSYEHRLENSAIDLHRYYSTYYYMQYVLYSDEVDVIMMDE